MSHLKPLYPCPIVIVPVGHMSVSRLGSGEDKCSVVYSSGKFMGDRDLPVLDPQLEVCSEFDLQVSKCLESHGQAFPAHQSIGTSSLDGIMPSSLRLGLPLDSLGLMNSEKDACDHIFGYQIDKPSLPVLQVGGLAKEVSKGMNAELGISSDV